MDSILAKYGNQISKDNLPPRLSIEKITELWCPNDTEKRHPLAQAIYSACRMGELPSYFEGETQAKEAGERVPRGGEYLFRCFFALSLTTIHRDDFKKWLISEKVWPLPGEIPLSKWFTDHDEPGLNAKSGKRQKSKILWDGARVIAREMRQKDPSLTLRDLAESDDINQYLNENYRRLFGNEKAAGFSVETIEKRLQNL